MGSCRALPYHHHHHEPFDWINIPPLALNLITTTKHCLSLRLYHLLHQRRRLLHSSVAKLSRLCHVPILMDQWREKASQFNGVDFFQFTNDAFASSLCFFNGGGDIKNSGNEGTAHVDTTRRNLFNGRQCTSILLAVNVLVYIAQFATQGKLLFWGAKKLGSVMSYRFCKSPAVGASGAIFGLVGSFAVFIMRHRNILGGGKEDLQHIAQVIMLNMAIGLLTKGIDNWGHVGGLLGGAAMSWLLGPALKYEFTSIDGSRIFSDRAPIFYLLDRKRKPRPLN